MYQTLKIILVTVFIFTLNGCSTFTISHFGATENGYQACKGNNQSNWNDCFGYTLFTENGVILGFMKSYYKNGYVDGKVIYTEKNINQSCEWRMENKIKQGLEICTKIDTGAIISKKFFINGVESQEELKKIELEDNKRECLNLGFKDKTPEMGNCILKLRELENSKRNNSSNSSSAVIKTGPTEAEKLNALNQMLQSVQQITGGAQTSPPNRAGVICTKVSEQRNGIYKTCIYNCAGTSTSTTVKASEMCAANTNF